MIIISELDAYEPLPFHLTRAPVRSNHSAQALSGPTSLIRAKMNNCYKDYLDGHLNIHISIILLYKSSLNSPRG